MSTTGQEMQVESPQHVTAQLTFDQLMALESAKQQTALQQQQAALQQQQAALQQKLASQAKIREEEARQKTLEMEREMTAQAAPPAAGPPGAGAGTGAGAAAGASAPPTALPGPATMVAPGFTHEYLTQIGLRRAPASYQTFHSNREHVYRITTQTGEEHVTLLHDTDYQQGILIRQAYQDIFNLIVGTDAQLFYVNGTKGIGKSTFAKYCIFQFLRRGTPVLFVEQPTIGNTRYVVFLYAPCGVYQITHDYYLQPPTHFIDLLDRQAIYIPDSVIPDTHYEHLAKRILISTPKDDIAQWVRRYRTFYLYMPTWTALEMSQLNAYFLRFHDNRPTNSNPAELYNLFGGIPRLVFVTSRERIAQLLQSALADARNLSELDAQIQRGQVTGEWSNVLVHLNPKVTALGDVNYTESQVSWASQAMREMARKAYEHSFVTFPDIGDPQGGAVNQELQMERED